MPFCSVGEAGHRRGLRRSASSWGLWGVRTVVLGVQVRKRVFCSTWLLGRRKSPILNPPSALSEPFVTFWGARAEPQTPGRATTSFQVLSLELCREAVCLLLGSVSRGGSSCRCVPATGVCAQRRVGVSGTLAGAAGHRRRSVRNLARAWGCVLGYSVS